MFEAYHGASPDRGVDGRSAHVRAGCFDCVRYTGLRAKDTVVGYLDVSGYADLSREDTMCADLGTAGYTNLCAEERGRADLDVMPDLDKIVQFGVGANDGRTHHSTVDSGVGSNLHIVFYDDISYLRDLPVDTLCVGFETEAIRADYCAGMEDTVRSNEAVIIDFDAGIEDGIVADRHIIADIDMRIDLHAFPRRTLRPMYANAPIYASDGICTPSATKDGCSTPLRGGFIALETMERSCAIAPRALGTRMKAPETPPRPSPQGREFGSEMRDWVMRTTPALVLARKGRYFSSVTKERCLGSAASMGATSQTIEDAFPYSSPPKRAAICCALNSMKLFTI